MSTGQEPIRQPAAALKARDRRYRETEHSSLKYTTQASAVWLAELTVHGLPIAGSSPSFFLNSHVLSA